MIGDDDGFVSTPDFEEPQHMTTEAPILGLLHNINQTMLANNQQIHDRLNQIEREVFAQQETQAHFRTQYLTQAAIIHQMQETLVNFRQLDSCSPGQLQREHVEQTFAADLTSRLRKVNRPGARTRRRQQAAMRCVGAEVEMSHAAPARMSPGSSEVLPDLTIGETRHQNPTFESAAGAVATTFNLQSESRNARDELDIGEEWKSSPRCCLRFATCVPPLVPGAMKNAWWALPSIGGLNMHPLPKKIHASADHEYCQALHATTPQALNTPLPQQIHTSEDHKCSPSPHASVSQISSWVELARLLVHLELTPPNIACWAREQLRTVRTERVKGQSFELAQLLKFATGDDNFYDLDGVPLLLRGDGEVVKFQSSFRAKDVILVPRTTSEWSLLCCPWLQKLGQKYVVAHDWKLQPDVWTLITRIASSGTTQCRFFETERVRTVFECLLPQTWNAKVPLVCAKDWSDSVCEWLKAFWMWLDECDIPVHEFTNWPIIPSVEPIDPTAPIHLHRVPPKNQIKEILVATNQASMLLQEVRRTCEWEIIHLPDWFRQHKVATQCLVF